MDDESSAITIESYRLKFNNPSEFIKSLKQTINHNLRSNRIPMNFEFIIKDDYGNNVKYDDNWKTGKNTYTIHAKGIHKPIFKLITFNINYKIWYRYQMLINRPKPYSEIELLLSTIQTIFSEYLIEDKSAINFLPLPKDHQLTTSEPIVIKPKNVLIPFGLVSGYSLATNLVLWPQYVFFGAFVALTLVLYYFISERS
jgi:hypothetical protein